MDGYRAAWCSKSSMASWQFCRFSSGSQVTSSSGQPPPLPLDQILYGPSSSALAYDTLDLILCFTCVVKFGRIDFGSQLLDARRKYSAAVAVRFQQVNVED